VRDEESAWRKRRPRSGAHVPLWAAFEVKLGLRESDAVAEHLLRLKGRIDTEAAGQPLALTVITATGYG
jgi:hypothetical protein